MVKKIISFGFSFCLLTFISAQEIDEQILTEDGTPLEEYYIDGIVQKTSLEESSVLNLDQPRESDVAWEKKLWRVIDVREKKNQIFRSPLKPFYTILEEILESGDVAVFNDEFFRDPMSTEELDGKLNKVDTTTVWDPDEMIEKVAIIRNKINWENIKQFRIKEVWYFDSEVSIMKCRIIGISPMLDEYDEFTGELKYSLPLFWVYYPEAKDQLAKYRVENDYNDNSPLSWYDIFEMRYFSSYIMKRSNILDLRIKDKIYNNITEGVDKLLASEKIKAELFSLEHDLWEY